MIYIWTVPIVSLMVGGFIIVIIVLFANDTICAIGVPTFPGVELPTLDFEYVELEASGGNPIDKPNQMKIWTLLNERDIVQGRTSIFRIESYDLVYIKSCYTTNTGGTIFTVRCTFLSEAAQTIGYTVEQVTPFVNTGTTIYGNNGQEVVFQINSSINPHHMMINTNNIPETTIVRIPTTFPR